MSSAREKKEWKYLRVYLKQYAQESFNLKMFFKEKNYKLVFNRFMVA